MSEDDIVYVLNSNVPDPEETYTPWWAPYFSMLRAYRTLPDYDGPDPCELGPCPEMVDWP